MKIGILTRRYGYNLGSTLQAFAMAKMINELGQEVEIMDYDESSVHWIWKVRPTIEHFLYKIPSNILPIKRSYLEHRHAQEILFKKFETKYMPVKGLRICSSNDLRIASESYDKIILGSDQIWSPFLFDPNFFGSFLHKKNKSKLVPYAPSIGTSNIEDIEQKQIDLMKSLPVLSCREEEGASIIGQLTGKPVEVVLDPTLMIDRTIWEKMAVVSYVPNLPSRYILTYFLGKDIHQDVVSEMGAKMDCDIYNISMFNNVKGFRCGIELKNVGPLEFLSLIKNASFVLTDSFHATVFSWLFQTDFRVFLRFKDDEPKNQNSRIQTLISTLGCESHLYDNKVKDSAGEFEVKKKISFDYLKLALQL